MFGSSSSGGSKARTIIASAIGNGLEWFDFLSYGLLAGSIAVAFFPDHAPGSGLILAFATFAVGFAVRPIGGVLLGLYADKAGRRGALAVMMGMMSGGSLLLALAPAYDQIGIAAPLLVVAARIVQGLSVGGEFAGSATFLVEHAPPGRRMFYGSFQMCAQGVGILAASLFIFALEQNLTPDAFGTWGWRIPFAAGAIIGPVGLYLRWRVAETPEFCAPVSKSLAAGSVLRALRTEAPALRCGIGLIAVGTAIAYLWHSYLVVYVVHELHLTRTDALLSASASGALAVCLYPLAGWLGDRLGAFRLFSWSTAIFAALTWPLYAWLTGAPDFERLMAAQLVATAFLAFISACHPGLLAMLFPVKVRTTGVALCYNFSVLAFGGLAPLTVSWLVARTGSPMMPAVYQIVVAGLSLLLVLSASSARRQALARNTATKDNPSSIFR
ncbi:MFS transporter [Xanthobacter variabilis]|uniref:MFS transporter n=1 Tax=Xanthobacter variabilis TaxID=3119932 RepID=UPI00374E22C6